MEKVIGEVHVFVIIEKRNKVKDKKWMKINYGDEHQLQNQFAFFCFTDYLHYYDETTDALLWKDRAIAHLQQLMKTEPEKRKFYLLEPNPSQKEMEKWHPIHFEIEWPNQNKWHSFWTRLFQ